LKVQGGSTISQAWHRGGIRSCNRSCNLCSTSSCKWWTCPTYYL